jgi:hypothetical protein
MYKGNPRNTKQLEGNIESKTVGITAKTEMGLSLNSARKVDHVIRVIYRIMQPLT